MAQDTRRLGEGLQQQQLLASRGRSRGTPAKNSSLWLMFLMTRTHCLGSHASIRSISMNG